MRGSKVLRLVNLVMANESHEVGRTLQSSSSRSRVSSSLDMPSLEAALLSKSMSCCMLGSEGSSISSSCCTLRSSLEGVSAKTSAAIVTL